MSCKLDNIGDFLLVAEAAAYLRVAKSTVYDWIHSRKIPFRKHGGRVVLSRKTLEAWSEQQEIPAASRDSFAIHENCVKRLPKPNKGGSLKIEQNGDDKAQHANGGL